MQRINFSTGIKLYKAQAQHVHTILTILDVRNERIQATKCKCEQLKNCAYLHVMLIIQALSTRMLYGDVTYSRRI